MFLRQNECDEIIRLLLVEFPGLINGESVDAEGLVDELRHQIKTSPQINREYREKEWGK